VAADEQESQGA